MFKIDIQTNHWKTKTPFEAWSGHKPNVSHFKVFGSKAQPRIPPDKRKELQPQRKECIIIGYAEYSNGYKKFYPSSHKIFIERSVQFKKEPMQEIKLVQGDCSHPPLRDDLSDDYSYDFSDCYVDYGYNDMNSYRDSPIQSKWLRKPYKQLMILLEIHQTLGRLHLNFTMPSLLVN